MKKALIIALAATVVTIGFGSTDVLAKSKKRAAAVTHNVTYVYGLKSVTVQVPHGGNATIPLDVAVYAVADIMVVTLYEKSSGFIFVTKYDDAFEYCPSVIE